MVFSLPFPALTSHASKLILALLTPKLQASSIQSLGGTCESLTIGHNPFKLPLSAHAVFLPNGARKNFLCEEALKRGRLEAGKGQTGGESSMSLLGEFANLKKRSNR